MKMLMRLIAGMTLTAFLGLSALESFHTHATLQTDANCSVCQIAHKTPVLTSTTPTPQPQWAIADARTPAPLSLYIQFVAVAHGLSPPPL